jgi:hypothetical protein
VSDSPPSWLQETGWANARWRRRFDWTWLPLPLGEMLETSAERDYRDRGAAFDPESLLRDIVPLALYTRDERASRLFGIAQQGLRTFEATYGAYYGEGHQLLVMYRVCLRICAENYGIQVLDGQRSMNQTVSRQARPGAPGYIGTQSSWFNPGFWIPSAAKAANSQELLTLMAASCLALEEQRRELRVLGVSELDVAYQLIQGHRKRPKER